MKILGIETSCDETAVIYIKNFCEIFRKYRVAAREVNSRLRNNFKF